MAEQQHNVRWCVNVAMQSGAEHDLCEMGVFRGVSFRELVKSARQYYLHAYGVDSFEGMGPPGPHDILEDGRNPYPEGKFGKNGDAVKRQIEKELAAMGHGRNGGKRYTLIKGFVPEVLKKMHGRRFSVVYLDMDHYAPTIHAANWAWRRLDPGGIILFDDFLSSKRDVLATRAAVEFMRKKQGEYDVLWPPGDPVNQIALQKRKE